MPALAVSLLVHLTAALLWPHRPAPAGPPAPLLVRLAPPAEPAPAAPRPPRPPPGTVAASPHALPQTHSDAAARGAVETPSVPAAEPAIDIGAVLARARAIAHEVQPAAPAGPAKPPATLATVIAHAAKAHTISESRGANGEWIVTDGKRRCVARIQRKWFEDGTPMLPLCEVRKG